MKQFTCKEMGGVCDAVIEGNTAEEVAQKGTKHVMSAGDDHKDLKVGMEMMSQEDNEKWMEEFKKKFDEKPEE